MGMFCYQCALALNGNGCETTGICGKDAQTAHLQNLLLAWCHHIAVTMVKVRQLDRSSNLVDRFLVEALSSTMTNVNFDVQDIARLVSLAYRISQFVEYLATAENLEYQAALEEQVMAPIEAMDEAQIAELVDQGRAHSIEERQKEYGAQNAGLMELVLDGLKGVAAYIWHLFSLVKPVHRKWNEEITDLKMQLKRIKGKEPKDRQRKADIRANIEQKGQLQSELIANKRKLLDGLIQILAILFEEATDQEQLLNAAMEVGQLNLLAINLLEDAHRICFGLQEPTVVRLTPVQGKCILVSGHDLNDLYDLLVQTEGKDINVYTHGELLPAHARPAFKRFSHLVGHYGGAWYLQQKEFDGFPGAILMTSNCIQKPEESYHDYIFTTGSVRWPGVKTIEVDKNGHKDFSPLIRAANDSSGFFRSKGTDKITIGFGVDAIINLKDTIRKALNASHLKRFYLIGGCDGPEMKREYFTELAKIIPDDCIILTLGCGKYRFNKMAFKPLPSGLPRLFDLGQCNDVSGAIRLVQHLIEEFGVRAEQLPVSFFLSWHEQKAVAILLTLLSLNIRGIYIGPVVPAFITPNILALLADRFELKLITDPKSDLEETLKLKQTGTRMI